jgi:hypothetical protein
MENKLEKYIRAIIEIIISIFLGFLVWDLGLFTFIGYIFAFLGALRKNLFLRKKKMAWKLFVGTLLIYFAGIFLPLIFNSWISGDWFSGILMTGFAIYLWLKGKKIRKK